MNRSIVKLFAILISLLIFPAIYAQKSQFNNILSLKLSGSLVNSGVNEFVPNPLFMLGVDYEVNKFVDVGLYGGYASLMHKTDVPYNPITGQYEWYSADSTSYITGTSGFYLSSQAFYYGVNSNLHLLPLFFSGNMRIDLYATPKIGWVSEQYYAYNATIEKVWSKPFFEYSMGLGLKYYFGRRFGISGEYSLGRFYNSNSSRATAGFVIKF